MNTLTSLAKLASLNSAKAVFQRGTDCLGPEEVERVFGIKLAEVPPIPFTEEELVRARELNQALVLFVPTDGEGQLLTMKALCDQLGNKIGDGKLLYDTMGWYKGENFFTTNPIVTKATWKLVSRDVIPCSTGVNYLGQTEAIARYLVEEVYQGLEMPALYQVALDEFTDRKDALVKMMKLDDWQKTAEVLASLKLNQLFRPTPGEMLYTIALYMGVNGERLLEKMYHWSAIRSSSGRLVYIGRAGSGGAGVDGGDPRYSYGSLGVSFSRSGLAES